MNKLVAVAALLTGVSPALAGSPAAKEHVLVERGLTFRYSVQKFADHSMITGSDSNGTRFSFKEKGGWVKGHYGMSSVSFPSPHKAAPVEVASR